MERRQLHLISNMAASFMGTEANGNYFVVMDTNGTVVGCASIGQ